MFRLVIRKLLHNIGFTACLLAGLAFSVAIAASIPMYTDGVLQRMLLKDLENSQQEDNSYPGHYMIQVNIADNYLAQDRMAAYAWLNANMDDQTVNRLGLPYEKAKRVGFASMVFSAKGQSGGGQKLTASLYGITGYEKHVQLVAGRFPQGQAEDGTYEVIAALPMQKAMDIVVGDTLELTDGTAQMEPIRVRVVGLFQKPQSSDGWWSTPDNRYASCFLMDPALLESHFIGEKHAVDSAAWIYTLDYGHLTIDRLPQYLAQLQSQKQFFGARAGAIWEMPNAVTTVLNGYAARAAQLRLTLWVLQAPLLILLGFFLFMVSHMNVENDRDEIAVMISRGASRFQVFRLYLLQSLLMSGVAVAAGPWLALGICKVIGASNGFMELVARAAIPVRVNGQAMLYAAVAGAFSVLVVILPVIRAARFSIVERKQRKARHWNAPLWQKMFLDAVLLGAAVYGLYQYRLRQQTVLLAADKGTLIPVDPFLFLISTAFALGCALLALRAFPYLVRLLARAGDRFWPPAAHLALMQVGRSGGREQYLMIFLILSICVGLFNSNSARTINENISDRIGYQDGADIALQMRWPSNRLVKTAMPGAASAELVTYRNQALTYGEPDFSAFSKLEGTGAAARVFVPDDAVNLSGPDHRAVSGKLMAIVPDEFSKVVWYKEGLLPFSINTYLNLLASAPNAVLISRQMMDDLRLKPGDAIDCTWGQSTVRGIVYAAVDYWPSLNPLEEKSKYFAILNLKYVQGRTSVQPYQLWYRRLPGATSQQIYDDITAKKMNVLWIRDLKQDLAKRKNDPLLQGTNGVMTMGFLASQAISIIGFFLYGALSVRSRSLLFGVLRAMGMSARRVLAALAMEQLLVCFAAILAGVFIGGLMSQLFIPLLGIAYNAAEQVPPFAAIARRGDYLRLYASVGAMLAAGLVLLGILLRRIRIAQAIKLGED